MNLLSFAGKRGKAKDKVAKAVMVQNANAFGRRGINLCAADMDKRVRLMKLCCHFSNSGSSLSAKEEVEKLDEKRDKDRSTKMNRISSLLEEISKFNRACEFVKDVLLHQNKPNRNGGAASSSKNLKKKKSKSKGTVNETEDESVRLLTDAQLATLMEKVGGLEDSEWCVMWDECEEMLKEAFT